MATDDLIQLTDVTKSYQQHTVLHDVNLTIKTGEFVALLVNRVVVNQRCSG